MRLGRGIHRHLTSVVLVVRLNDDSRVLPGVPRLFLCRRAPYTLFFVN